MKHEFEPPSGNTMSIAKYVRNALELVKDERTSIDSGGGFGCCDLWVKIDGREFFITIKECRPK